MQREKDAMTASVEFTLTRPAEEQAELLAAVEDFAVRRGLTNAVRFRLGLVIDEMVANCIAHGACAGQDQGIRIDVTDRENEVEIKIVDSGPRFDPTAQAAASCRNGDVKVGGIGLCLVCNLSAEVAYDRRGDANHARITLDKSTQAQTCNSTK